MDPMRPSPAKALTPSRHRLRWMWQLEPAVSLAYLAMKVTLMPAVSATSFKHCLKSTWRSAASSTGA